MMNWGDDDLVWATAKVWETEGLPIEPLALEIQAGRDIEDQLIISHEDPPSHLRG